MVEERMGDVGEVAETVKGEKMEEAQKPEEPKKKTAREMLNTGRAQLTEQNKRDLVEQAKADREITDDDLMRSVGLNPESKHDSDLFIAFMSTRRGFIDKHHKAIDKRKERERQAEQRAKVEDEVKAEKQAIKDSIIKNKIMLAKRKEMESEQVTRDKRRTAMFGEDVYKSKDDLTDLDIPLLLYGILKQLERLNGEMKTGKAKPKEKVKSKK